MKKIAITGTTHGIGKAISEKFEKEGWEVIHLDRNICNVSYMSDIELLELPKIDAFINNAGIMPLIDFEQDDLRNWNNVVNTNLRGPLKH
jgi:NADP-dependent 3-hydroxy acid dehydrogenase YdfG